MLGLLLPGSHAFNAAAPAARRHAAASAPAAAPTMAAGDTRRGGKGQVAAKSRRMTKALCWTERYIDEESGRWLGRVQTAEPSTLQTPCAAGPP